MKQELDTCASMDKDRHQAEKSPKGGTLVTPTVRSWGVKTKPKSQPEGHK